MSKVKRTIGCIVSIGTGTVPDLALRGNEGLGGNFKHLLSLKDVVMDSLTNSELAHIAMSKLGKTGMLTEDYFRFNAPLGLKNPKSKDPGCGRYGEPMWQDSCREVVQLKDVIPLCMQFL